MLSKVNIALLSPFLGFHCLTTLIICLNHEVVFKSLLFMILQSLNHIQLPLFMLNEVNFTLFKTVCKVLLSVQAYNMVK